jgi:hypothetical protein
MAIAAWAAFVFIGYKCAIDATPPVDLQHTIDIQNERITRLGSELKDTRARLTACQSRPPSDATCTAWLFQTNLSAARKRMCGR